MLELKFEETRPRLLVVGFSARAAAFCACQAGFDPVAIDGCADRDLMALCTDYAGWHQPDAIHEIESRNGELPYLLAGGMEHRLDWVDELAAQSTGYGCTRSQMVEMRSLSQWMNWSSGCGISFPATWSHKDGIESLAKHDWEGEWLVKSTMGVGGLDVEHWSNRDVSFIADYFQSRPNHYLQHKIHGKSIGVTFASSQFGSIPIGAALSIDSATQPFVSKYAYAGSCGPIVLSGEQWCSLWDFANSVGGCTGFRGLWQADFIISPSGELVLLEINPRWSASMEILDTCLGLRLVSLHHRCVQGMLGIEEWKTIAAHIRDAPSNKMLGKMIAYAPRDFVVTDNQSDRWWDRLWDGELEKLTSRCGFADIPLGGTRVGQGQPILTCMVSGNSIGEMQSRLEIEIARLL
jgi:uncharacterized protein